MANVPEGFELLGRSSPVTRPWEPIYCRREPDCLTLGLRAGAAHLNSRGFVHGGLLAALADNAMGYSCFEHLGAEAELVTASLSIDYVAAAREGQWLTFETSFVKAGRAIAFAQAFVRADGTVCARANATFRVHQHGNEPIRPIPNEAPEPKSGG